MNIKPRNLSYAHGGSQQGLQWITIGELLREISSKYPDNEALVSVHQDIRYNYKRFYEICRAAAKGFIKLGVKKGDRVAIWATNYPEWLFTMFGTGIIGSILVPVNPAFRAHELEYVLRDSQSKILVMIEKFKTSDYPQMLKTVCPEIVNCQPTAIKCEKLPELKGVVMIGKSTEPWMLSWDELLKIGEEVSDEELAKRESELDPDDIINIQYTSGTTGFPKGASLTHHGLINNAFFVAQTMHFTDKDRLCIPVPFYHCFGMVLSVLACVTHGATMVLPSEYFEPLAVLKAVEKERCTALHGVPTMFIAELAQPEFSQFNLSSLRTGIMAGAPCPMELMKKVMEKMNMRDVTICYGLTECSPVTNQTRIDDDVELRVKTVGTPAPHTEIKIIDPITNKVVPVGTPGELCARGYQVMRGYHGKPKETAETIDEQGWLHTGDLAVMDSNGYCSIVGRLKEMIIRGGENVYPREIEEFFYTNPKIKTVQVFGVPDKKYGEEICAWIELKPGESATPEEIIEFCKGRLAHYKIPKYIKFVSEFPMTVTGKVKKYVMREMMMKELGLEKDGFKIQS
jgi:fatty-acyl-CoA synthase